MNDEWINGELVWKEIESNFIHQIAVLLFCTEKVLIILFNLMCMKINNCLSYPLNSYKLTKNRSKIYYLKILQCYSKVEFEIRINGRQQTNQMLIHLLTLRNSINNSRCTVIIKF